MKRIFILLASLFFFVWSAATNVSMAEEFGDPNWLDYADLKEHVKWAATVAAEKDVALAGADNGAWGACWGTTELDAKDCAKKTCTTYSEGRPCLVVDVNIKRLEHSLRKLYETHGGKERGSSLAEVWCVASNNVFKTTRTYCNSKALKSFSTRTQAEVELERAKNQLSTVTTTTSNSSTQGWCATKQTVFKSTDTYCDTKGGKWKWTYSAARAEHRYLKNESSAVATTSGSSTRGWCADSVSVWQISKGWCAVHNGEWFLVEAEAEAEHLRLKRQSSTVVTSSSNSSVAGWCATELGVYNDHAVDCDIKGGNWSLFYEVAKAEHLRLKDQSSTVATTTEAVDPQPAEINQSALELEFWKTIKDSDDPDMFREYVRQFPSGTYVGLAKIKIKKLTGSTTSVAQASIPSLDYGNYHALVIGNNRYRHLKPLSTAVNDANAVASLLRSQYQFNVDVLINATRDETVSALSRLRKSITPRDNLLIYYAGHGWLDKEMDEGFWLPVDATDDDQVDWIANDTIMRSVRAMKAKHVMVVADSCFSGTLIRGIKIKERSPDYIKEISQKKARTALTSGGIEPVTDVGGGDHSIFAATFIRILSENDGVLDGHQLFTTLRARVMMGADQTPEYGDIRKAGHDGGDFLFVRQ